MPSVVKYSFTKVNGQLVTKAEVGEKKVDTATDLRNLVSSAKRLIGLSKKTLGTNKRLEEMYNSGAFNITPLDPADESTPMVIPLYHQDAVCKKVHAVEVSAAILARLMDAVHRSFGTTISSCIVTVPAYFNENQIESTKEACRIAALPLTRTLNEPVAAAFAYQMIQPDRQLPRTLVFDMGGGTLDISIVEYEQDVLEVLCYSGDNFLGGDDVDSALFMHFLSILERTHRADEPTKLRLRRFAEEFKIELCTAQLELDNAHAGQDAVCSKDFHYTMQETVPFTLSTSQFNAVIDPVIQRVRNCVVATNARGQVVNPDAILAKYSGDIKDIGAVLLVGGSTKLPVIRAMLRAIFGDSTVKTQLDPDTCVAEGACWYAAAFSGLADLPAHVDVVSVPIGICVGEDTFSPIIKMNATVPAIGKEVFTTSVDMQPKVVIRVGQGFRSLFQHAHYLGEFTLDIDNPGPRGVPKIEVTIQIDKDRTLTVIAMDMLTKKQANIVFTRSSHTLSEEDIQRMIKERESKKEEDERIRKRTEAYTTLDLYLSTLRQRIALSNMHDNDKNSLYERISKEESWLKTQKDLATTNELTEKYETLKAFIEPQLLKHDETTKQEEQFRETQKVREEL